MPNVQLVKLMNRFLSFPYFYLFFFFVSLPEFFLISFFFGGFPLKIYYYVSDDRRWGVFLFSWLKFSKYPSQIFCRFPGMDTYLA